MKGENLNLKLLHEMHNEKGKQEGHYSRTNTVSHNLETNLNSELWLLANLKKVSIFIYLNIVA